MIGDFPFKTTFEELITKGDLQIGDGYRAKNNELGGNGIIFLRAGHVNDRGIDFSGADRLNDDVTANLEAKTSKAGDTIVTTKGNSTGRSSFVEEWMPEFVYSPHLSFWRSGNQDTIDNGFLRYWSKSKEFLDQLNGMKVSTDMAPYLSLTDQRRLQITLTSIQEQRFASQILSTLDDKIELNRKTNETLEDIAKALFKSWFVDFDPVRAKAEGRPIGLPNEISELFPDSFEDSELGEIPSGWSWQSLGDLTTLDKGVSYKGAFLSENEGVPMVNLGCFAGAGKFREEKMKFYMGDYKDRHLASSGEIFVANTDMTQNRIILGSPVLMPRWKGHEKYLFSHHVFALRLSAETSVWSGFIYHSLLRPEFRQIASGYATGTTVLALPKDGILEFMIPKAPIQLVHSFNSVFQPIAERIESALEINRTLNELRDALLPRLISGELRVPDAEKMLQEAGV